MNVFLAIVLIVVCCLSYACAQVPLECTDPTIPRPPNLVCPIQTPGNIGVGGVSAVSSFKSCNSFGTALDCGPDQNVTVLILGLNPGVGRSTEYDFRSITSIDAGQAKNYDGASCASDGSRCLITENVRIVVNMSSVTIGYALTNTGIIFPTAYSAFQSNAFRRTDSNIKDGCIGGIAERLTLTTTQKSDPRKTGVRFQYPCNPFNYEGQVKQWPGGQCCVEGTQSGRTCWSNRLKPLGFIDSLIWNRAESRRLAFCDMPMPNPGKTNFGMVMKDGLLQFNDDYTGDHGDCTPNCRSEGDDDEDDDSDRQCGNAFPRMTNSTGCRLLFGNFKYVGYDTKKRIKWSTSWEADPDGYFTTDIRPVIPGYGNIYSPFPGIPPVEGSVLNWPPGKPTCLSKWDKETPKSKYRVCFGPDDDDASTCMSQSFIESGTNVEQFAVHCPATKVDSCNPNREGFSAKSATGYLASGRYDTTSSMGYIGPQCYLYKVDPTGIPLFSASAIMYDAAGSILDEVTITNYAGGDSTTTPGTVNVQQSFVGKNNRMIFSILDINTGSTTYAPEVGGYITICNNGPDWLYMGLGPNGRDNPWPEIKRRYNAANFQSKQTGFVPLPEFLHYVQQKGNTDGAWFFWRPTSAANEFGGGCNQLGIKMAFFNDEFNADQICKSCRYACVPGFEHTCEPDFTLQDRMTALATGSNEEQRRVDAISPKTPGQVSTYYQQWETITSRQQFIDLYQRYKFLPPSWLDFEATDTTQDPENVGNYWIHGPMLMFKSRAFNSDRIYAQFQLGVRGELLDVSTTIAVGRFVIDDTPTRCAVQRNSFDGSALLTVENTSADGIGDYIVLTNCTNGIEVRSEPVLELSPRTRGTAFVQLAQSGVVFNQSACTFILSHPTYRNVIFDRIDSYNCQVTEAIGGDPFRNFSRASPCLDWAVGCEIQNYGPGNNNTDSAFGMWMMLLFTVGSIFAVVMAALLYKKGDKALNQSLAYDKRVRKSESQNK